MNSYLYTSEKINILYILKNTKILMSINLQKFIILISIKHGFTILKIIMKIKI